MARHTFVAVPGHPGVTVSTEPEHGMITWHGVAEGLLRAGAASPEMLEQRRGVDDGGYRFYVYRIPGRRARAPRLGLTRHMPVAAAIKLPGVQAAYARYREHAERMRPHLEKVPSLPELLSQAAPLAEVLCSPGEVQWRDRAVGRMQRRARWIVNGNLIAPDWRLGRPA